MLRAVSLTDSVNVFVLQNLVKIISSRDATDDLQEQPTVRPDTLQHSLLHSALACSLPVMENKAMNGKL
jgi:hypothetical protein